MLRSGRAHYASLSTPDGLEVAVSGLHTPGLKRQFSTSGLESQAKNGLGPHARMKLPSPSRYERRQLIPRTRRWVW